MTSRPTPPHRTPHPRRLGLGLLASFALLVACTGPIASIQLALGSSGAIVIRGGSVDVVVTLTRTGGGSGPIALSVTGLPANVTASFAPAALDGAVMDSVLTLSATASAIEAMRTLTVEAIGASLTAEATLDLTIESLNLDGQVLGLFGVPLTAVHVASQGETTVTDANGAFELDGLSTPYDLVLSTAVGSGGVHVFEGLTIAAPVFNPAFALDAGLPVPEGATVAGTVLGGAVVAANREVIVCAEGLEQMAIGCDVVDPGGTTYVLDVAWFGPTTTSVRLHALHLQTGVDGVPTAYLGYETFDLSLSDGDGVARALALAPVATTLVEGVIAATGGMTITTATGAVRFGPQLSMQVFTSTALVDAVSVLMPAPPGATYDFVAVADGPAGASIAWTVDQEGDFGLLAAPFPLTQGSPPDGTLGVDLTTPFTSTGSAQVRTYYFESVAGPQLALTTARTSVTVPDPTEAGFPSRPPPTMTGSSWATAHRTPMRRWTAAWSTTTGCCSPRARAGQDTTRTDRSP